MQRSICVSLVARNSVPCAVCICHANTDIAASEAVSVSAPTDTPRGRRRFLGSVTHSGRVTPSRRTASTNPIETNPMIERCLRN